MPKPERQVELHTTDPRYAKKKLHQAYVQLQRWARHQRSPRREDDEKGRPLCPRVDQTPRT